MLRTSHRMPSSSGVALVTLLSARLPSHFPWPHVELPPAQHLPRKSSSNREFSLLHRSSGRPSNAHLDWRRLGPALQSEGHRPLPLLLVSDRREGGSHQRQHQQRLQQQGLFAEAGGGRSSLMASQGVTAAARAVGAAKEQKEELVLDRDSFSKETTVVAVKVPAKRTSELRTRLKKELMNVPHRKNVERCPGDDSCRLLLLSPSVKDPDTLEGLSDETAAFLNGDADLETTAFNVKTEYSMLGVEEVLTRLLEPRLPGRDVPTSFEVAGHLAHLNLRDYLLPHKKVIGQVIIDKNPRITTVVNKVDTISTQFRTFPMEVVAGEPNTEVVVKESGCSFRFDFAKVYWNSRLQTEHARLIKIIGQSEQWKNKPAVVCDMMAGVGPFAVPLAKNGHRVFANDLNPDSYSALRDNGFRNKVAGRLTTSNECGRAFARKLIRERQVFHHAILNLPDSALTFLDTFRGVDWKANGFEAPPMVHVYCFSKAADPKQDALDRANEVMGSSLTQRKVKIHVVRDVAPNKPMLCLSFLAPDADGADSGNCADKDAAETPASATDRSGATAPIAAAVDEAGAGAAGTASPSPPSVGSAAAGTAGASSTAAGSAAAAASSSDDATVVAATVASDSREEKDGVEEEEGSGPGAAACNKRQRTAAVPG
ncbi:unnamed protein product [Pylaiella littoralis]